MLSRLIDMMLPSHIFYLTLWVIVCFSPSIECLCHESERIALLQFKNAFFIDELASINPGAYPKTESWNSSGNGNDCCMWDGISCDENSSYVIGVDLGSSCLYGAIEHNTSLLNLVHLQKLILADNNFLNSSIPSGLGRLTNLNHLDLSSASFSGLIPTEISMLSNLVYLDLSWNFDFSTGVLLLKLHKEAFANIFVNLKRLEVLNLSEVSISSEIPRTFTNLSSLSAFYCRDCGLHGIFPEGIFQMPNLQILYLGNNEGLVGKLPNFWNNSKLQVLSLFSTGFFGLIPISIGSLSFLTELNLRACNFQGTIPHSLGNLTLLNTLSLGANNLTGEIPSSLAALTDLVALVLEGNHLTGRIPAWISTLVELNALTLGRNNFAGPVDFNMFLQLKQLQYLRLQGIELAFPAKIYQSSVYPQFREMYMQGCGLTRFPDFLHNQNSLGVLILDDNKIHGAIPKWLWNISRETLIILWIDNNFLTGFGEHPQILPWTNLYSLALNGNDLKGSFPLPSLLLAEYYLADNELNGQIPSLICNSTLKSIDLSLNRFSGEIPQCLGNLSRSLQYLFLRQNDLNGSIPEGFPEDCELQMINLRNNRLAGRIPRSLANCSSLEVLDLGGNQINDVFPSWFGDLPELQALALGSNNLHGELPAKLDAGFRKLRIIDLSANAFSGYLSNELFLGWPAMRAEAAQQSYMFSNVYTVLNKGNVNDTFMYTITITDKGVERSYPKIMNVFVVVDLSNNRFEGEIPGSLDNLLGLQALNLSYNNLTGGIPSSLTKLAQLESLDLSRNMLSGNIPLQLAMPFLEVFNVSYNNLSGPIPQSTQWSTFQNDSYLGNPGLCGSPLSRSCGTVIGSLTPAQPLPEEDEGDSLIIDWVIRSLGYLSGLVIGVIMGYMITNEHHEWFVETFGRKQRNKRRARRRPRSN